MSNRILGFAVGLLAIHVGVHAGEITTSIFDDDWKPAPPSQVEPASKPVPPVPAPVAPTTAPQTKAPAPVVPVPNPQVVISQDVRIGVPPAAAQASAWKLIKDDLYKNDIAKAKTPTQKIELAKKMLVVAGDTTKDPVGKYVLLAQAKEIAIGSGDPTTAFKCLDEMGKAYLIDYPSMKMGLFSAMSTTVTMPADMQMIVEGLNRWADGQVQNDRFDVAKSAVQLAMTVARKSGDAQLTAQAAAHLRQIGEIEAGQVEVKKSLALLEKDPKNASANLVAGKFYCLVKGDWTKGLPMLALGGDAALKTLASADLAGATTAAAQSDLGDSWWAVAEKMTGIARTHVEERACKWYSQAAPGLNGLAKAKAEMRMKQTEGTRHQEERAFLADLPETYASASHKLGKNAELGYDGLAMTVNGTPLHHGLSTRPWHHGFAHVIYDLSQQQFTVLKATAALDDSAGTVRVQRKLPPLAFLIVGDGKELWRSKPMNKSGDSDACEVDISGVKRLDLYVECKGDNAYANAVWVDPVLIKRELPVGNKLPGKRK